MQAGETRLRPDAATSALLMAALQALQRLATCPQLQEEMCAVRAFGSVFSLLDCGCERVSMEAARLLTRLWAPAAARRGGKPFVNASAGEEYAETLPEVAYQVPAACSPSPETGPAGGQSACPRLREPHRCHHLVFVLFSGACDRRGGRQRAATHGRAICHLDHGGDTRARAQVRATKELCFEAERRDMHVAALVDGLVASSGNELLSVALIEAAAALVAEPEAATTSEAVRTCVSFVLFTPACLWVSRGAGQIVQRRAIILFEYQRTWRPAGSDTHRRCDPTAQEQLRRCVVTALTAVGTRAWRVWLVHKTGAAHACRQVRQRLAQAGGALFRLMASPAARASEGVMAIVRETLSISPAASWPIRDAALDEGIIVKHLLLAVRPLPRGAY